MGIMGEWYNGYRFGGSRHRSVQHRHGAHYLKHSIPNRRVPTYLIDTNVRIDYGKLRHLLVSRQLNGNDLLRDIVGGSRSTPASSPASRWSASPIRRTSCRYCITSDC